MRNTIIALAFLHTALAQAQNDRINTYGSVGWYNVFGTFKLGDKWGVHSEYQWRRDDVITDWQQSLARVGVNHQLTPSILLRAGYAWIETFPYGELPINGLGRDFTEHRLFEMIQLSHKEGILDLSHRFMLEQRFVGRYSDPLSEREDEFPLVHRIRYMIRLQVPLKGDQVADKTPYAAVYNELFIGFGRNVNANVFDQNRTGLLLGYRINSTIRLEAGYFSQVLQFGRRMDDRSIFQTNRGIIINGHFNFDRMRKQN
jgi:hypothetical protein